MGKKEKAGSGAVKTGRMNLFVVVGHPRNYNMKQRELTTRNGERRPDSKERNNSRPREGYKER